jgi:hypothetical protein
MKKHNTGCYKVHGGVLQGPWTFESELVPTSEEEREALLLNSVGNDSEIVLEMEVQDLVSAYSISKVDMKGKDVLRASEDDGVTKVAAQPAFVRVNPDAETDDQFIGTEGNKTSKMDESMIEEQTVSYVDLSFEDFKLEWMLLFYPYWAHPLLKHLKHEREKEEDQ